MSGCYFQKGLFIHFKVCGVFFYILLKTDRSEVQIDSKEGYLTQVSSAVSKSIFESSNSVEFEGQEVGSGWIFQSFEFGGSNHHYHQSLNREGRMGTTDDFATSIAVVQKHSYKLDYQDKFLVLKHGS